MDDKVRLAATRLHYWLSPGSKQGATDTDIAALAAGVLRLHVAVELERIISVSGGREGRLAEAVCLILTQNMQIVFITIAKIPVGVNLIADFPILDAVILRL